MATIDKHSKTEINSSPPLLITFEGVIWALFFCCLTFLIYNLPHRPSFSIPGIVNLNTFTIMMWLAITLFSGIVYRFSSSYMAGFSRLSAFGGYILGATLSVLLFVAAEHLVLLWVSWLSMGFFMAKLIGCVPNWPEAGEASAICMRYFAGSSFVLAVGLFTMWQATGLLTISGIMANINAFTMAELIIAGITLIIAGIVQASIYPFHRWLLSAMTAPTPSSALMHAGFVNAAAILFAKFAPLLIAGDLLITIFLAGAIGTLLAQFWKLVQVHYKQRLASSTAAQMGFMIMQCGLGFFTAGVAHLILHGFYKTYLFFSSGSGIQRNSPEGPQNRTVAWKHIPVILLSGLLGGVLFVWLTGKGWAVDSGVFLTFIVVITVMHGALHLLQEKSIPVSQRMVFIPAMVIPAIALYALVYNAVTFLMQPIPMAGQATSLSLWHIIIGTIFLAAYIFMEIGAYRKFPRLYVWLLNNTQPHKKTTLAFKKHLV